jgi:hypothetical protein
MAASVTYGAFTWLVFTWEGEKKLMRQITNNDPNASGWTAFEDLAGNVEYLNPVATVQPSGNRTDRPASGQTYRSRSGRHIFSTNVAAPAGI